MMAELKRKEEQLTTADLAGRSETEPKTSHAVRDMEDAARPKPVRSEAAAPNYRGSTAPASPQQTTRAVQDDTAPAALFTESDINDLRSRWSNVQTGFVDEPRRAVEEADKLVAAVMQRLAEGFANERSNLEKAWGRADNVSTEDLRVALRRYRSFFDRLLHA